MNNMKYLNTVLTALAVLLALNLWSGLNTAPSQGISLESQAIAQGRVDAGQQRAEMIKELKGLKSTVEAMSSKLSDGSIKVKVEGEPDKD
jgi:cell division protein FtsB